MHHSQLAKSVLLFVAIVAAAGHVGQARTGQASTIPAPPDVKAPPAALEIK